MRGEQVARRRRLPRLPVVALILLHQHAGALQGHKGGVAFVHVAEGRRDAQGGQGAHAADAQDDLLLQAHFRIAAVELVGDVLVVVLIGGDVGVEQIERNAPHLHLPDLRVDVAARKIHADAERLAVRVRLRLHRHVIEIVVGVALLLPAVGVERLAEVALLIQQAHADERDAQIAGRFEMVAGENAQAAGVDRQALGQAELHREIGDAGLGRRFVFIVALEPGVLARM